MNIAGWFVWGMSLLWFLGFLYLTRKEKLIHVAILVQLIIWMVSIVVFAFSSLSKLHLLWVMPAGFLLGFIVAFTILTLPVIGPVFRDVLLLFAHVFFFGTDYQLGGAPWAIATQRAAAYQLDMDSRLAKMDWKSPDEFESAIKERQDLLFGYNLYHQVIKLIHSGGFHDDPTMDSANSHYFQLKERDTKAVMEANELLASIKRGEKDMSHLKRFSFPPIHSTPQLAGFIGRSKALVRAYEKLFPGRPRDQELSEEERSSLIDAAMTEWSIKV